MLEVNKMYLKGDYVLCYSEWDRQNIPLDLLANQMASLGWVNKNNGDGTYNLAIYDQLGYGMEQTWVNEDVPEEFMYPARMRAWYNLWTTGGYQSYLIGYALVAGVYLLYIR